jgi:hypothetical protein
MKYEEFIRLQARIRLDVMKVKTMAELLNSTHLFTQYDLASELEAEIRMIGIRLGYIKGEDLTAEEKIQEILEAVDLVKKDFAAVNAEFYLDQVYWLLNHIKELEKKLNE